MKNNIKNNTTAAQLLECGNVALNSSVPQILSVQICNILEALNNPCSLWCSKMCSWS